ncbi:MAG TPA: hypothetical protein VIS73_11950 [Rhodocyclaceae bacterium]
MPEQVALTGPYSQKTQSCETNYVSATLTLYLDICSICASLLRLIMALAGERD